jgi:hypothetical protein
MRDSNQAEITYTAKIHPPTNQNKVSNLANRLSRNNKL